MTALISPRGSHRRKGRRGPSGAIKGVSVIAGPGTGFGIAAAFATRALAICSGGASAAQPVAAASNSAAIAARDPRDRAAAAFRLLTCQYQIIDRAAPTGIIAPAARSIRAQTLFRIAKEMPFEIIEIDEMVAACNGGGGPLGHPRVYLNRLPAGRVERPYCSREFVNRAMAGRVPPEIGVVMPSAHQPGEERPEESPAPRQT